MKVTLIYPCIGINPSYNYGLGIIAAYLKENGHQIQGFSIYAPNGEKIDLENIENQIRTFNPGLIGFSSVSNQFMFVKKIANHLRKNGIKTKILVGGIHATVSPESVLKEDFVDMVCLGEGEYACLELVNKLEKKEDISDIKNIWLKKNGIIIKNEIRPLIEDLGSLPFPDRDAFNFKKTLEKKRGWVNMLAGRGCIFKCSYCVNSFLFKFYKKKWNIRLRPVDHVIEEIAEIEKNYGKHNVKMINFNDDNFTMSNKWIMEFCEKYPNRIKYPFACNIRPTNFDEKIANNLKNAGCAEIKIGLESGSKRVREEILNRYMTNEQIEKAFMIAKSSGIRTWSFNMIGMPTETKEELLETIKLNAKIRPYIIRCAIMYPYRGSDFYDDCIKEGNLNKNKEFKYASNFEGTILKLEHFTEVDIFKYKTMFKWYVDAYSDIEIADFYKNMIRSFEKLPDSLWETGKAQRLFKEVDGKIDDFFKQMKKEHYSSRVHLYLNFSSEQNWELP